MYKLQPLFKAAAETPHPSCVYKMKKISDHFNHNNTDNGATESTTQNTGDCEVEELEKRWTEITSRLTRLQSELAAIKSGSSTGLSSIVDTGPAPPLTVKALAVQQDLLVLRISSLMTSLFELKSRLAVMDDPQSISSTTFLQLQQMSLLERIRELNDEIRSISSALNNNNNSHERKSSSPLPQCYTNQCQAYVVESGDRSFQDLVIKASPSRPPHSLPLLQQQIEKLGVPVYARTHVHSTAAGHKLLDANLKSLISSNSRLERSEAQIAITLIWTQDEVEEPTLMVSPSSQAVAIKGEANIARYLARLVPGLDYETQPLKAAQIDQYLDLAETSGPLGVRGTKRERAGTLQLLDKTLSSKKSLGGGNEVGLVDFVVYSALVNSGVDKEIGQNIRAWMDRCRSSVTTASPSSDSKRSLLEKYLSELGIAFRTLEHPAVFTVAAMMEHISHLAGFHAKNLLVKDKKTGKLYLITARHDAAIQLNHLAKAVGAKELRFADAETLEASLGVQQGSVTPFALLNDAREHRVAFVLDAQLWNDKIDGKDSYLNFHPLTNEATTSITVAGFKTFLKATGHDPIIIQV